MMAAMMVDDLVVMMVDLMDDKRVETMVVKLVA